MRDALVVTQVALTAVLLVVAGLLLRSLGASQRADVGFDPRGLAAISLDTDMVRYTPERSRRVLARSAGARARAARRAIGRLRRRPRCRLTFNFSTSEMRVDSRTYSEGQRGEIIENTVDFADLPGNARRADHRRPRVSRRPTSPAAPKWS